MGSPAIGNVKLFGFAYMLIVLLQLSHRIVDIFGTAADSHRWEEAHVRLPSCLPS